MFRIVNRHRTEIVEIEPQVLFSSLGPDGLRLDPGVAVGDRRDLRADRPRAILVQRRRNRLERAVSIDVPADGRQGTRVDRHQSHPPYRAALRRSRDARLVINNCHQISATKMVTVTPFAKHTLALAALCATGIGFATFRPAQTAAPVANIQYLIYVASEAADSISLVRFGPDGGRLDHDRGDRHHADRHRRPARPRDVAGPSVLLRVDRARAADSGASGSIRRDRRGRRPRRRSACSRRRCRRRRTASCSTSSTSTCTATWCLRRCRSSPPARCSKVARIPTCTMPHGSRINPQGTKHYSACMMDDMLVEIDTRDAEGLAPFHADERRRGRSHRIARAGRLGPRPRHGGARTRGAEGAGGHLLADLGAAVSRRRSVYVACNASNEIVEVEAGTWTVTRTNGCRHGRLQSGGHEGWPAARRPTSADSRSRSSTRATAASSREFPRSAASSTAWSSRLTTGMRSCRSRASAPSQAPWR